MKIIVTAGAKGADIDVFACVAAYAELLRIEGHDSIPVVAGSFTSSVAPSILEWGAEYRADYEPGDSETFVLVDISDPDQFPAFVSPDRIGEIYDHRYGYEDYWQERLKENAHIEMIGSCGTLIWEQFKKRGKEGKISVTSAKLLLASIVSNNLAFRSPLATERDRSAYAELSAITGLGDDWTAEYFSEQEKILFDDFERYVRADTKVAKISNGDFAIGQIELWDATSLLDESRRAELDAIMAEFDPVPWVVNILDISNGFNLVYSKSPGGKKIFEQKIGVRFDGDVAKTDSLLMRKHLLKVLRD